MKPEDNARSDWHPDTLAIRSGHERTAFGEHSEPVYATSSFVFNTAAEAADRFSGEEAGYIYSRFTNPTVAAFETRLAALEGGESCIGTASGMSAILATVLTLLKSGDHMVATRSLFGSTVNLFQKFLPRFGIEVDWVQIDDPRQWESAIKPNTRVFFLETPNNPLVELADIKALAAITQPRDIKLVVDNCFCSPALQQPLKLGADIVIHSATKYLDGQGRCVGGAVVGPSSYINADLYGYMRSAGPTLSPFNAWVFLKGLETLSLRMERHCQNAALIASWLSEHPAVEAVHYPGLSFHPQHALAKAQMSGFGGVVSLRLRGGQTAAWQLIDSVRVPSITANLGDAKSTITHPETTTHARMAEADRRDVGITPSLIRIAVGLENSDDLIADLDQAMEGL